MFSKILVPYDSSKPSQVAAKYAARLANASKENCEILLVHVIPNVPATSLVLERPVKTKKGDTVMLSEYVKKLYEEMQVHAVQRLERQKKEIESVAGLKATIRTVVVIGDSISGELLEMAEKEKVDLIIIGNIGLAGFSKLKTLGSVSRAVSERSPCPVMIIH